MPLRNIGSLLPYHSHVDAGTVVGALNHMIDDVNNGNTVFHDFYEENEKKEQPTKSNTGLFFFRGKPGAPFAVIAAGGGFSYVAAVHEGFPYAVAIAKQGYNAFVLKYRTVSGGAVATRDLGAAISYVFRNAKGLGVGTKGYSLWGSSAGGRMAASIGSHGVARYGGDDLPKPSAVVMAYTGHSEYSADEPSTFVVVGERDGIASPSVMERRVWALRKTGTKVEFHHYHDLGHGFGPGIGTTAKDGSSAPYDSGRGPSGQTRGICDEHHSSRDTTHAKSAVLDVVPTGHSGRFHRCRGHRHVRWRDGAGTQGCSDT